MTTKRPSPPQTKWEWYSICSTHREYQEDCGRCNAGRWISKGETEFNNWLWTYSPSIWRKWANRSNVSGWRQWFREHIWRPRDE